MIEINLLPGGKKKAAPGAGFKLKLALPDFRALLANVKDPWLIAAVVAWIIAGGGSAALFITERARLAVVESRLDSVRAEKRRFDVVIAQKRQSEKIRDSLVAEINVIRGIDSDRYIWPHVLDQITKALPPYTWLTNIAAVAVIAPGGAPTPPTTDSSGATVVRLTISGSTVDIQAYTTFLRQLAASPWLTDVAPATSQTIIEADRPVTAFNVGLRFKVADSVYMRTVPLAQSLRERLWRSGSPPISAARSCCSSSSSPRRGATSSGPRCTRRWRGGSATRSRRRTACRPSSTAPRRTSRAARWRTCGARSRNTRQCSA